MKFKQKSRKAWSEEECVEVVILYNTFLDSELDGKPYQKAGPVRELAAKLDRSKGSIEAKLMNVSGVRVELGLPYVNGYKPLSGYQGLLKEVVVKVGS